MKGLIEKMTEKQLIKCLGIHSTLIGFKSNEEVVIPEAIRLMNFEEFIANMKNDKSETQLIKEIIIHLLNHLELKNSQFFESCLALLTDTFSPYKSEIINKYYLEIAYEFYQNNQKQGSIQKDFIKDKLFFQQKFNVKLDILSLLVKRQIINNNMDFYENSKKQNHFNETLSMYNSKFSKKENQKSKDGEENKKQQNSQEELIQKKILVKEKTTVLLGEDGQNYYVYCPSLPQFILKFGTNGMKKYNKKQTLTLIRYFLSEPRQLSKLVLIERISHIYKNYQIEEIPKFHVRMINVKHKLSHKQKLEWIKSSLLQTFEEYNNLLKIYQNKCYAPLYVRQQMTSLLKECENETKIVQWLRNFYDKTKKNVYECSTTEEKLPKHPEEQKQFYTLRYWKKMFLYTTQINCFCSKPFTISIHTVVDLVFKTQYGKLPWLQILMLCLKQSVDRLSVSNKQKSQKMQRLMKEPEEKEQKIVYQKRKGLIALESNQDSDYKKDVPLKNSCLM